MQDGVKLADIERKKAEVENEENNQEENNELWKKFFGNHMVTAVDIPEKNLTLIVDSTNPSIGVFANGEIDMFWNKSGDGIELAFLGNALQNGKFGISETFEEIAKSFLKTKYSKDELIAEYGLEAQNAALQFIKEEDTKQIQENKEKSKVLISDYSNSSQMNKNVSNTVNTRPNIREDEER